MPPRKRHVQAAAKRKRNNYVAKKRNYQPIQNKRIPGPFKRFTTVDPLPNIYNCKLTYTHTSNLSTGIGGIYGTEQVMRCNSPYDPDFTGTGHQPYGYDQLTGLYKLYLVKGILVECVITDPSADGLVIGATFQSSQDATTITSNPIDTIKEQPMSITRSINNSGAQMVRFKQYFTIAQLESLTKNQFDGALGAYQAAINANPARFPYFRIAAGSVRGATGDTCIVRITATFYTMFSGRVTQAQS